jgi:hypothetical protein
MEPWIADKIEPLLLPTTSAWQPNDLLPDSASPDFVEAVRALRAECTNLPLEYLVVLVGDMVTEEALPSYMSMLNRMHGTSDRTGGFRDALATVDLTPISTLALSSFFSTQQSLSKFIWSLTRQADSRRYLPWCTWQVRAPVNDWAV